MSGIRSFRVDKGSHTNTLLRGGNTWSKIRSEATQPMCLRPSEPASDYSSLLCDFAKKTLNCLLVLLRVKLIRAATIQRIMIDQSKVVRN